MPSRVSTQRLSGASETSAPHRGVVEPSVEVGGEGVLAGVPARSVPAVVPEGDGLGERDVQAHRPGRSRWPPGPPRGRGSAGSAGGRRGRRRPGSCRPGGGTRWRGGCGPGRARSRCATGRAPRAGPVGRRPRPRVAPGASWSSSRPSRAGRSSPGRPTTGPPVPMSLSPTEAWLSAWAKVIPGPPWPAMVDAHRRFLSLGPCSGPASGTGASCSVMGPVCPKGVTLGAAGTRASEAAGNWGGGQLGRRAAGRRATGAAAAGRTGTPGLADLVSSEAAGSPAQAQLRGACQVDVRIGIVQSMKELDVELPDDADRDKVLADIETALGRGRDVLWLTDRKGRQVGVPVGQGGLRRGGRARRARSPGRLRRSLIRRAAPTGRRRAAVGRSA